MAEPAFILTFQNLELVLKVKMNILPSILPLIYFYGPAYPMYTWQLDSTEQIVCMFALYMSL